jgi:molybdenum cofactor cytidylyltransferase
MKFGSVAVADAEGAVLAHGLSVASVVFKKGRVLTSQDIAMLQTAGVAQVTVARLEPGDVHEDEAARALALAACGPGSVAQQAFTGRANLQATGAGLVVVDAPRVRAINHLHESLTIATLPSWHSVLPKQMLATIKIIPFATPRRVLDDALRIAGEGPLVKVRAFQKKSIGLVTTTLPQTKQGLVTKSEQSIRQRLSAFGLDLAQVSVVPHVQAETAAAIGQQLQHGADCVLVFGASAIVDRGDVIPAALVEAGGTVVHLGMPVDPGNLLMLGQHGAVPVLGVPSCARSPKRNGFDWVLERVLAGIHVTSEDIMDMGAGGLLAEIPSRPRPREFEVGRAPCVVAVVLAAGLGTRMGGNKMLAMLDGKPMIVATVENIKASGVDSVVVVTGHGSADVEAALAAHDVSFAHNADYATGLSSSLRVGVAAAGHADAVLVCLGDMPRVQAAVIDRMIAAFNPTEHRSIVVPSHQGKPGNPVLWGAEHFDKLASVVGDKGDRMLLMGLTDEVVDVEADEGVLIDADTPDALRSIAGS